MGYTSDCTPGDITLSGDLYEGNFEEWYRRIDAWMKCHELRGHVGLYAKNCRRLHLADSKKAAKYTCERTCVAMLRRVPDDHRNHSVKLMETLKKLATPFRLLDLPAEIRNIVYDFVLPSRLTVQDNSASCMETGDDDLFGESDTLYYRVAYPPVLQVNSQIRHEASSIFYANTTFYIHLPANGTYNDFDKETIEQWSKNIVAHNMKTLRHVVLGINLEASINITFSEEYGLVCDFEEESGEISEQGEEMLDKHTLAIESARKTIGLRGEAIILALLSNWSM